MRTFSVLLIILLVASFITNPSYDDYKNWFSDEIATEIGSTTELEKTIAGWFTDIASDASIERKDYKLFSIYETEVGDYQYKVIGVFNNFFNLSAN